MLISKNDTTNIEACIQEMEGKHNLHLPDEYRRFLQTYNGGRTPETSFSIKGMSSDIRAFYSTGKPNQQFDISLIENTPLFSGLINEGLFPIAINSFGDHIAIGLSEDRCGRIYYCVHDAPMSAVEIASSLQAFIANCHSRRIGYIRSIDERIADMQAAGKADKITEIKLRCWQQEIDEYLDIKQEEVHLPLP